MFSKSNKYTLPDDAVPSERFNKALAEEALHMANEFLKKIKAEFDAKLADSDLGFWKSVRTSMQKLV